MDNKESTTVWLAGYHYNLTRAVVSPAAQSVVAAAWFGISKAAQAIKEGVTDLEVLDFNVLI